MSLYRLFRLKMDTAATPALRRRSCQLLFSASLCYELI